MRAREYEPSTGRFLSEDPAKHRLNWFQYANNEPVSSIDFSGTIDYTELVRLFHNMSEAFYEGLRPALEGGRLGEYLQEHWEDLGRDSMAFSAGGMWRGGTTLAWRIGLRILVEDAILEDMGITITNMGVADVPTEAIGGLIEGANSAHFFGE